MLRKFFAIFLIAIAPVAATTVTILTFNDVYEISPEEGWGGLAEMKTLLDRERADADFSITTVNGDFLSPSVLSSVTRGAHMVELFNLLEIDMVVHGNHEFDFGPDVVMQRMNEREFLWFGTNVLDVNGFPFAGADVTSMVEVDGLKIGFFGACTPDTAKISNPGLDITFQPIIECARETVAELRAQGADVIIALTHQTVLEDMELAKQVPEIDLILGGHEHQEITFQRTTLIHKSGSDARYLGRIDLDIDKQGDTVIIVPHWRMIPNFNTDPDPVVKARVDAYNELLDEQLGVVIGCTTSDFGSCQLLADAMRLETGADCALVNDGIVYDDDVVPCDTPITRGTIAQLLPFANMVMVVEIRGDQLLEVLRYGLIATKSKTRLPHLSGLTANCRNGEIFDARVGDAPLDPQATYSLAITDYLYRGGDGYTHFAGLPITLHPEADNTVDLLFTRYLTAAL